MAGLKGGNIITGYKRLADVMTSMQVLLFLCERLGITMGEERFIKGRPD